MDRFLPHLAARVQQPMLVEPRRLEQVLSVLSDRVGLEAKVFLGCDDDDPFAAPKPRTEGGVRIIPIHGTLVSRALGINALSGLCSYEDLRSSLLAAERDSGVSAVVLDVDSPGGEVQGAFEAASLIAALSKPVVASVNHNAMSAGYLLASGAKRVVVSHDGLCGSIGVVAAHVDRSAADAEAGRKYTFVYAGARKVDGNPHEPLSDDAREDLQRHVDRIYGNFVAVVAKRRGLDVSAVRSQEARVYAGSEAVSAGLADSLGGLEEAISEARTCSRRSPFNAGRFPAGVKA